MNLRVPGSVWKKLGWALALAGPVVCAGCKKAEIKAPKDEAPEVLISYPSESEITDFEDFTGRTAAMYTNNIQARVSGFLDKIAFTDGSMVQKGQLLFQIDPRPYKAQLDRTTALLAQAKAKAKRTEADYQAQAGQLQPRGDLRREEFDLTADEYAEAKASVGVAEADKSMAQLNMDWTEVHAPISGRISRRMVDVGNLIKADDTLLTTIVSVDPMYIYFDIDERTMLRLRRLVREGKIKSRSEAEVPVLAALADEEDFPHLGTVDFSENVVDPSTRDPPRVRRGDRQPVPLRDLPRPLHPRPPADRLAAQVADDRRAGARHRPGEEVRLRRQRGDEEGLPAVRQRRRPPGGEAGDRLGPEGRRDGRRQRHAARPGGAEGEPDRREQGPHVDRPGRDLGPRARRSPRGK